MKDEIKIIEVNGINYPMVFNLNVMESLQNEYGTFKNWTKKVENSENNEVDIRALKFGIKEMINEGIDMQNDNAEIKRDFINDRQIGRILTSFGSKEIFAKMQDLIIESTETENNSKNE